MDEVTYYEVPDSDHSLVIRILLHAIDALRTRPLGEVLDNPGSLWDGVANPRDGATDG